MIFKTPKSHNELAILLQGRLRMATALSVVFFCGLAQAIANVSVNASFNPPVVSVGQRTSYVVAIEGAKGTPSGTLPVVNGLQIGNQPSVSTSNNISVINGAMNAVTTTSLVFPATAMAEGVYTVPDWTITIEGKSYQVPAAQLQVTPVGEELKNAFFFKLEPSLEKAYVGQALPMRVRLYWRQDVRLDLSAQPAKQAGEAFTDVDFNFNPQQDTAVVNNVIYNTASWPFLLTPLKAGKQPIGFNCEIVVQMPGQNGRRMDPFFDSPFFNRGNFERRALTTGLIELEVLNPPEQGKPESFSGAIGQFSIETKASPLDVEQSEPITLSVSVTGSGNLERMGAPALEAVDGWRIYPPSATFTKTDDLGYTGSKVYEYILRPESAEVKYLPELRFSYFDPLTESYRELKGTEFAVNVKESASPVFPVAGSSEPRQGSATARRNTGMEMQPLLVLDKGHGELIPLWRQAPFWVAQSVPGLGLLALCLVGYFRGKEHANPLLRKHRKLAAALQETLQNANKAAESNKAEEFTNAAHDTLQTLVALLSGGILEPRAVTWADAEECFTKAKLNTDEVQGCRSLFTAYEAGKFGGLTIATHELPAKRERLNAVVKKLTTR